MCADPETDWGMLGKVLRLSVLQVCFFFFLNTDLHFSCFGCTGSLLLRAGFLWFWRAGAAL